MINRSFSPCGMSETGHITPQDRDKEVVLAWEYLFIQTRKDGGSESDEYEDGYTQRCLNLLDLQQTQAGVVKLSACAVEYLSSNHARLLKGRTSFQRLK